MSRTHDETLTPEELTHLREEFWLNLLGMVEDFRETTGLDRRISFEEVKEIMDLITVAMHYVKNDFLLNPDQYTDVMAAEADFFRDILQEAGAFPTLV